MTLFINASKLLKRENFYSSKLLKRENFNIHIFKLIIKWNFQTKKKIGKLKILMQKMEILSNVYIYSLKH